MVVNFRRKDINTAGVRVSGTKITATPDEINQALAGIAADVTAANLSEVTGGGETDLHSHAASGGGASISFYWSIDSLGDTALHEFAALVDGPAQNARTGAWTNDEHGNLVPPEDGTYEGRWSIHGQLTDQDCFAYVQINSATSVYALRLFGYFVAGYAAGASGELSEDRTVISRVGPLSGPDRSLGVLQVQHMLAGGSFNALTINLTITKVAD